MLLRHLASLRPLTLGGRTIGARQYTLMGLLPTSTSLLGRHTASPSQAHPVLALVAARFFSQELVAGWPEGIRNFLKQERIEKPTLIQEKTLPIAMQNKNLVGIARTGSGKTLAFVIPAVMKVLKAREQAAESTADGGDAHSEGVDFGRAEHEDVQRTGDRDYRRDNDNGNDLPRGNALALNRPTCLVLAPTRELATQTASVFGRFQSMGIRTISLVGGAARSDQLNRLQRHHFDVYVATPGRLIDLVETNSVDLSAIKYLVMDEADRMLDMGFEPQIRRLLETMPADKQTLMWSATWPPEIQELANDYLNKFEYIAVDSAKLKANPNIKQVIKICEPHNRLSQMIESLREFRVDCPEPRVLIFVNTKRMADSMLTHLMRNRIRAIAIHGDRSQNQRDQALRMFKERQCHVLVATDVAARGLDISDITHVINFDFPNTIEDYIHRIGRTARHERQGTALSLFTVNSGSMARKLIQVLRETNQHVPDGLEEMQVYGGAADSQNSFAGRGMSRARRHNDRNDFGYRRPNDRRDYGNRGGGGGYGRNSGGYGRSQQDDDFEDESPYERNDRFDRFGQGSGPRKARGGSIFDD